MLIRLTIMLMLLCANAAAVPCYPSYSFAIGVYSPQCNPDHTWKKKQCWASTGTCWCVDTLTGEKLTEPIRTRNLTCDLPQ